MKNIRIIGIIVLGIVFLSLVGCSNQNADNQVSNNTNEQNSKPKDKTTFGLKPLDKRETLRVGFFSGSPHSMPWYIAEQEGFWDELNIDIEYVPFINGPAMMEANNNWDMASVGAPGVLVGQLGHGLKMIGAVDYEKNLGLFVRADSPILNDRAAYKGTTWLYPVGTSLHMTFTRALEKSNLTIDDVKSINMDVTSALTAFKGGEADGIAVWNAIAFAAEDAGFVRLDDSATLGVTNLIGMMANDQALNEKKELVKTAWMVYYLTWEWCQSSPENMEKTYAYFLESCENEGVAVNEDIAKRSMDYFAAPSLQEAVTTMIKTVPDEKYNKREVLEGERDLLVTMDFFISQGKYSDDDRTMVLDNNMVDNSIAIEVEKSLTEINGLK